ncbi:MAG: exosortase C-terminal domain/associated protein EpsI, partial [Gammaproteobacteria bacterium]
SIPITVLMNSFRIGVIGVLVEYYGIEQAEGFLHDFEGWVIFMASMGVLFIEMAILAKVGKNKKKLSDVFTIELPAPVVKSCVRHENKVTVIHYTLVATLALFSVSTLYIQDREDILLTRAEFSEFPDRIGGWSGHKEKLEPVILQSLNADDYIMSNYKNGNGDILNFYIAYYADQQAGSAAHSPRACIPGGGWQIKDLETVAIPELQMAGQPLSTNRLVIQKGDYGQLVYYWFQQRDRTITNEYLVKWYLFWDALTRNRTDGALVRLTTPIKPGEDHKLADQRLINFARLVQPLMDKYIPK